MQVCTHRLTHPPSSPTHPPTHAHTQVVVPLPPTHQRMHTRRWLCLTPPPPPLSPSQVVVSAKRPELPPPERCSAGLADLITRCWATSPADRPTASQVVECVRVLSAVHDGMPLLTHVAEQRCVHGADGMP